MFALKLDSTRHVSGLEVSLKTSFAATHSGDPAWVFIDGDQFFSRDEIGFFMRNPRLFYVDDLGFLRLDYALTPQS